MAQLLAPDSKLNCYGNELSSEVDHSKFSDEQLRSLIKEMSKSKNMILIENKILEKCVENCAYDISQPGTAKQSVSAYKDDDGYGFDRSRRRSTRTSTCTSMTGTNSDVFKSLSSEKKCEIAAISVGILQKEIRMMRGQKEKEINQIEIQLEEIDVRNNDIINEMTIFCKLIVDDGIHPICGFIRSEKVDQYFTKILKMKDLQIERCRLRIMTLKNVFKRLKKKLKDDDLNPTYPFEYELLRIENAELKARFEEIELELAKVKEDFHTILEDLRKNEYQAKKIKKIFERNQRTSNKLSKSHQY